MNIYEKMNLIKKACFGCQKTGKNRTFEYFELGDFMPTVVEKSEELKVFTQVIFDTDRARLEIRDAEKPEDVLTYFCSYANVNLSNCHEMQNLGAQQTYIRRYLYLVALDLSEGDILDRTFDPNKTPDKTPNKTTPPPPAPREPMSAEIKEVFDRIKEMPLDKEAKNNVLKKYKQPGIPLTLEDYQKAETELAKMIIDGVPA